MIDRNRILIVDDQASLRHMISNYMKKQGFQPIEAENGDEAISLYRMMKPGIVLTDIMMPGLNGLELLEEIRKIERSAIVILMTGLGSEDVLIEALRKGANNFYKKPFKVQEMTEWIKTIIRQHTEIDTMHLYSPAILEEQKTFQFKTKDANIVPIINQVFINTPALFSQEEIINLKIGLEEIITNAIEHGNLNISSEEKSDALEKGVFSELIQDRLNVDNNGDKLITVSTLLSPDSIQVTIQDEGTGFDWQELPPPSPDNLMQLSGRGIFLTKIFYDEVFFNDSGNEVTLIKEKSSPSTEDEVEEEDSILY